MIIQTTVPQTLTRWTQDDVLLTSVAALLAIAIICVLVLRAWCPVPLIHRPDRIGPMPRHKATGVMMAGRCRWQARGDLNDKDLRGWSCTNCGQHRWTSSRSVPPETC